MAGEARGSTRRQAAQRAKLEALRQRLASSPHAKGMRVLLASPAGQEVIRWLEEQFVFGELAGDTVEETYFNLGAREVVLTMKRLGTIAERTGENA